MTSIPPTSSTPPPEDSIQPVTTTQSTDSTKEQTQQSENAEENQDLSKKDSFKDEAADKVIALFCNSPYIDPATAEAMQENPDDVMQGVQVYTKQSRKSEQDLEQAQKDAEAVTKAYEPPPPEGQYENQTSKQQGG